MFVLQIRFLSFFFGIISILSFFNIIYSYYLNLYLNLNTYYYSLLQSSLKIDDLIDPRMTTVSSILKHIHKGTIENAYTISNGEYEVIEAEIIETSELINKEIKNSNLPEELRIGAVLRDKKIIIPRSNFVFKKDDKVVFIVKKDSISFVENIFRLSSV